MEPFFSNPKFHSAGSFGAPRNRLCRALLSERDSVCMHFRVSTRASALFIFLGSSSGRMPSKQKPHCSVCQIGGRRKLIPHPFVSKLSGGTDALICGTCLKDYKNVDWDTKLQNGSHVRNRSADRLRHVCGAWCEDTSYKNRTFVIHRIIRWHAFRSIRILAPAAGAATRPAAAICFFATSAPTRGARVSVLAASKLARFISPLVLVVQRASR
jgi:hypothetical protein